MFILLFKINLLKQKIKFKIRIKKLYYLKIFGFFFNFITTANKILPNKNYHK